MLCIVNYYLPFWFHLDKNLDIVKERYTYTQAGINKELISSEECVLVEVLLRPGDATLSFINTL